MNLRALTLFFIVFCLIIACKKHESPAPQKTVSPSPIDSAKSVDIFIVGSTVDSGISYYRKNGVFTKLNSNSQYSEAVAIAFHDTDVYIAGNLIAWDNTYTNRIKTAVYWKNGVLNMLANSTSETRSIAINDNDVYIAGSLDQGGVYNAVYWKNGVAVQLPAGPQFSSVASGIAFNGTDVYLSGSVNQKNQSSKAVCWKNGAMTTLTATQSSGSASAILVQGGDVYVTGTDSLVHGVFWKNGMITQLSKISANAITTNGRDIYITGSNDFIFDEYDGAYWKNGLIFDLGSGNPTGIAVNGTDVYISGYLNFEGNGEYWKNGVSDLMFGYPYLANGIGLRAHH